MFLCAGVGHPNEGLHPHAGRPHQHSCLRQMPGSRTTGRAALLVMLVLVLVVVVTGAMRVLVVTGAGGYQHCTGAGDYQCYASTVAGGYRCYADAGGYWCWWLPVLVASFFGWNVEVDWWIFVLNGFL